MNFWILKYEVSYQAILVDPEGRFPKPGDLIEFFRPFYQHWGIYVGKGYVVHLTDQKGWSSITSGFSAKAFVRKDRVRRVACGYTYRVNNKYDQKRPPKTPVKVVQAALELVGYNMPYSVTNGNCEHFVTELRYGDSFSDQVDDVWSQVLVGGGMAVFGIAAEIIFAVMKTKQNH
ncbi:phospholipase A and acyltransferase 3-like [Discoglossus pictus]